MEGANEPIGAGPGPMTLEDMLAPGASTLANGCRWRSDPAWRIMMCRRFYLAAHVETRKADWMRPQDDSLTDDKATTCLVQSIVSLGDNEYEKNNHGPSPVPQTMGTTISR